MRKKYPNWCHRHEGVLRWIFEHPALKQKDCAEALGYSVAQISRIINSDEFRIKIQALTETEFLENYRSPEKLIIIVVIWTYL